MKLGVIIPVFNHIYYTIKAVETLVQNTASDYVLIIVDDGSTDDTADYIRELERRNISIRYHKNIKNEGVHYSWNRGLEIAKAEAVDYICVANNDIMFAPNWDLPLIGTLEQSNGIVSPLQTTHAFPDDWPHGETRRKNDGELPILGCCFMFRSSLIDETGLFPEAMRYYFGDNWIVKECEKRGYLCSHIHSSYIHHFFSETSSKLDNNYWFEKDREEYLRL